MTIGAEVTGLSKTLGLVIAFEQHHLAQWNGEVPHRRRDDATKTLPMRSRLADDGGDALVEPVIARRVPQHLTADHETAEDRVQFVDLICRVSGEPLACTLFPGPDPCPNLLSRILWPYEKGEVAVFVARCDHRDGVGLIKARQVPESGVLTELVGNVVVANDLGGRRDDGKALGPDLRGQTAAVLCISVGHEREFTHASNPGRSRPLALLSQGTGWSSTMSGKWSDPIAGPRRRSTTDRVSL